MCVSPEAFRGQDRLVGVCSRSAWSVSVPPVDELTGPVLDHLERKNPGGVVGVYLFGSAALGGVRPDSDLDLLMVTERSLTRPERAELVSLLLSLSGWKGHAATYPEVAHRRPIELTSIVVDGERPFSVGAVRDFQYGEWLRDTLVGGGLPAPEEDPDTVVLIATAFTAHRVLCGLPLERVVAPVPRRRLRDALLANIPEILAGIEGDERNTLLALARTLVTLETGAITPKNVAADTVAQTLTGIDRELMERARDAYLGLAADRWDDVGAEVTALAHRLAARAR